MVIAFPSRHELAMWWTKAKQSVQLDQVERVYVMEKTAAEAAMFLMRPLGNSPDEGRMFRLLPAASDTESEAEPGNDATTASTEATSLD